MEDGGFEKETSKFKFDNKKMNNTITHVFIG